MEKRELALVGAMVGLLLALVIVLGGVLAYKYLLPSPPPPVVVQPGTPPPAVPPPVAPPPFTPANDVTAVTALISEWARAWENNVNSISLYQSYYDPDFFSNYKARSGMNYAEWMADKANKARKASCIRVGVGNVNVTIDNDFATATFLQDYASNNYCDSGYKTMYLIKRAGAWKIIGEEQPSTSKCANFCGAPASSGSSGQRQVVTETVYQWADAWQNNVYSMDAYRSFYDTDFYSNYKARSGMNYSEWMADKAAKARKTSCIQVQVSNLSVEIDGDFATARFLQRYLSNSYCDSGWKTLYLINRGGNWRIVGEEQPSVSRCGDRC